MWRFLLRKAGYGLLVLWGVVTAVFFLFNLSPGDPVRNLVGENAPAETVENIRRKLDLDLPLSTRYVRYLNDLSPVSVYPDSASGMRGAWSREEHGGSSLPGWSERYVVVVKPPYLKRSFLSDRSVTEILSEAIPGTVILAVTSIVLASLLGLLMGVYAALHRDTLADRLILVCSAIGMSGPSFFVAILVAWIGAIHWKETIHVPVLPVLFLVLALTAWHVIRRRKKEKGREGSSRILWAALALWLLCICFPSWPVFSWNLELPGTGLSMTGSLYGVSVWEGRYLEWRHLILPVVTLMIRPLAVIVQLTRSSLLDVLSREFIRTAHAKGLPRRRVIWVHALRNALNPVVTAVSGWFASLLAGAVFVEFVFGWKGLGQELFQAIEKQDMPVVMGGVILIAAAFTVINVAVDVLYGWIDPRVRA